jgi:ketosteroid isomerase-like protein
LNRKLIDMKNLILFLLTFTLISCIRKTDKAELEPQPTTNIDIQTELESIEQTRAAFQLAIKEKRYSDLSQFITSDMKSVSPGSEDWLEYKRIREKPMGQFSYDSIRMRPQETIIVSDTVAYDFGTSSVYYTNAEGKSVELTDTFLVILKRDKKDGKWRVHREVASAIVE